MSGELVEYNLQAENRDEVTMGVNTQYVSDPIYQYLLLDSRNMSYKY